MGLTKNWLGVFRGLRFAPGRRRWIIPTAIGLLITAFMFIAYQSRPALIERLGNLVFDSYQRAKPREYNPDIPVRIIDIDEESIRRIGQWPWPRTTLAQMNDRLFQAGAGVVSYDIVFAETDRTSPENMSAVFEANPAWTREQFDLSGLTSHDEVLSQSFANGNVVGAFFSGPFEDVQFPLKSGTINWSGDKPVNAMPSFPSARPSLPILQEGMSGEGFINLPADRIDGIVRTAPMVSLIGERDYPSLSFETLRAAQGVGFNLGKSSSGTREVLAGEKIDIHFSFLRSGQFDIPVTERGEFIVYYTEPDIEARYIPAWEILEGTGWEDRIGGHIVYVGTSAEGLKDIRATPMTPFSPGVEIHAQITEQIISQVFLNRPYTVIVLEAGTILVFGILLSLILPHLGAAKGAVLALVMGNGAFWSSWYAFSAKQTLLNPVYPLLTVAACYVIMTLVSLYLSEGDRARIRGAFSMYLSPDMVRRVSEDPDALKLGGEDRNITILFLDVRSFSRISENLSPSEITSFLNLFLTPMTDILQKHKATIDKYIGDAIVAFWNAPLEDPDHQENAARALLEMSATLKTLNAEYRQQTEIKWPDPLSMGIGVNTGICTVGNLGSKQRFSYSMIGDAANLASRIEGMTKAYGLELLIGTNTAQSLSNFAILEMDRVQVVGRQMPETIYTILGDERTRQSAPFRALLEKQSEFLTLYRAGDWTKASTLAETLEKSSADFAISRYYEVMHARISRYKANPPKDWDGIFVAESK